MRQQKIVEPQKSRLISFLRTLRTEKYGLPSVSASTIREWCEANNGVPEDMDAPFVVAFTIHAESVEPEEQDLKVVISTKRLLSLAQKSTLVQTDATYKLVWQGFPIIIVGTSDRENTFHPFALAVMKGETTQDFEFVFRAVHNFNLEWQPSCLLADASEAITNGYINVFGQPAVRIMCYFHVVQNITKYLRSAPARTCGHIRADIQALQHAQDDVTFQKASALFLKKWRREKDPVVVHFVQYFQDQWLSSNASWFEGAAPGFPSTNNGLEATNSWIKRGHTLRERLPVGQFLTSVIELLETWSHRRDPASVNCLKFADTPSIPLKVWTSAYQWAVGNRKVLQRSHGSGTNYFVTSSAMKEPLTTNLLATYEKVRGKWKDFGTFKHYNYGIWVIFLDSAHPTEATCTCPSFFKFGTCKHAVGMQIRLHLVDVPPAAKQIPLGQKRKRGRPAKAKRALLTQ